jgi:hypothetical protein
MMAKSDHHVTRNKKMADSRRYNNTHTFSCVCDGIGSPPEKEKRVLDTTEKIKEEKITWESDQKRPDVCAC